MKFLTHTGEYLELLRELLDGALGANSNKKDKAEIIFPSQIGSLDPSHPQVIIESLRFSKSYPSNDGRTTHHLDVDVFIKVPSNLADPEIISSAMVGYLLKDLQGQRFGYPSKTIENPRDIGASPIPWTNDGAGHQVNFSQVIHVGNVVEDPFELVSAEINRRKGDGEFDNVRRPEVPQGN